ncbi:hypothetical protein GCM10008922_14840 [Faecalicatena contorta]
MHADLCLSFISYPNTLIIISFVDNNKGGIYYGEIRIYPSFKQRPEYCKAGRSHAGNWTDKETDVY